MWPRMAVGACLIGLVVLFAGCAGQGRRPAQPPPVQTQEQRHGEGEAATAQTVTPLSPVPAALVQASLQAAAERPFVLSWADGEAGRSFPVQDRYYLRRGRQGFVQQGLRTWEVDTDDAGHESWNGPYTGLVPQLPFLNSLQEDPNLWGVVAAMAQVHQFLGKSVGVNGQIWVADLPPGGLELPVEGWPQQTIGLTVTLQRHDDAWLPTEYWAKVVDSDGKPRELTGTYRWEAPVARPVPKTPPQRELGWANIWLGDAREDVEPLLWVPEKRISFADGSEWTLHPGWRFAVKYDANGRVVVWSLKQGGLLNGLAIGASREQLEIFLGRPDTEQSEVVSYLYPSGNSLEVHLHDGKISEFRAVAPGQTPDGTVPPE
jgi:hypothetical protein